MSKRESYEKGYEDGVKRAEYLADQAEGDVGGGSIVTVGRDLLGGPMYYEPDGTPEYEQGFKDGKNGEPCDPPEEDEDDN